MAKRLKDLEKENSRLKRLLADAELDLGVSGGRIGMTEGKRSQLLEPVHCGNAQLSRQELLLAMTA